MFVCQQNPLYASVISKILHGVHIKYQNDFYLSIINQKAITFKEEIMLFICYAYIS